MKIGVAKEIKSDEYRVALTPAGARELADAGHDVLIEQGAGEGSAFPDDAYEAVGAQIVSVDDVWGDAELLLKVKEPIDAEYGRLRDGLVLFTYLHLAADKGLTNALVESGISAVAYETVETSNRALPLLAPMSEIAGRLAAQAGAYFLEKPLGGRGLLLGGVPGVAPGQVVVIGGGMVGYNSAVIALGLGANVTIIERSIDRMRHLEEVLGGRVTLLMSSSLQIEESVAQADVVIGAVLIPGAVAPKLVTRRDGRRHEGGLGDRRRRDRPGRLLRDRTTDDAFGARVRRRRRDALLRREHARRRADHRDEGPDERDAPVRRGDRDPWPARSRRARPGTCARRQRARRQDHVRSRRRSARPRLRTARGRPTAVAGLTGYELSGCGFFSCCGKSLTTSQVTPAASEVITTTKRKRPSSPRIGVS